MSDMHPPLWRPTKADAGDWFNPEQVQRSRDYVRPLRQAGRITTVVDLALFIVIVLTHAVPRLLHALGVTNWALGLVIGLALILVANLITSVPKDAWVSLSYDKKWELSTQTTGGWIQDQVKSLMLGVVLGGGVLIGIYAVIRHTADWWILGSVLMMAVTVFAVFAVPVLIMPLFNKFIPLQDGELRERIDAVAAKAGVTIKGSFTMDASKRSRRDNAFVAGFGPTKRVVVFDTMLEHPIGAVETVVAHEIGHYRLQHILTMLPAGLVATVISFGLSDALLRWHWLLQLGGVNSLANPGSLPLFIAVLGGTMSLFNLPSAFLSRHHEREADLEALRLLRDPGTFIDLWQRMAPKNLADLEPTMWKRLNATHPDVSERMSYARDWAQMNQVDIVAPPADAEGMAPAPA